MLAEDEGDGDADDDEVDADDEEEEEEEDAALRMTMNPESPRLAATSSRVLASTTHTHAVVAPTTRWGGGESGEG